jgi:hypothetical protein
VPSTLEGILVFVLAIAPGYLLVRGFSVGRNHVAPGRDLYVLAEAVVASVLWLAVVYLFAEERLSEYGLLPRNDTTLEAKGDHVAVFLLVVVLAPYVLGRALGLGLRVAIRATGWVLGRVDDWLAVVPRTSRQ